MPNDENLLSILYKPIINSLNFCLDLLNGNYKFIYILDCWNEQDKMFNLYTGQTNNIFKRFNDSTPGVYQNKKIVYLEIHSSKYDITSRKKEIHNLPYEQKISLIKKLNPEITEFLHNVNNKFIENKPKDHSKHIEKPPQSELLIPKEILQCNKFFKQTLIKNRAENSDSWIISKWISGTNQRDIANKYGVGLTTVNRIINNYKNNINLIDPRLNVQNIYSIWIAQKINAKSSTRDFQ